MEFKHKSILLNECIENLNIKNQDDIENEILDFFDKEREKAIDTLVEKENLEKEKIKDFINDYEFSNKYRDEYIKEALVEKLGLLQRKKKVELVKQNLINILTKFKLNLYWFIEYSKEWS